MRNLLKFVALIPPQEQDRESSQAKKNGKVFSIPFRSLARARSPAFSLTCYLHRQFNAKNEWCQGK